MGVLRRTPHSVVLTRPRVDRDSGTNATKLNYASPTLTKTVKGMFQSRGGELSISEEGLAQPFDAVFFTNDSDVKQNDRLEVALAFYTGNFIVVVAEPKVALSGRFDHTETFLRKDATR
jgi:hypothetical protein